MADTVANQVTQKIQEASAMYHHLVLVVGPSGFGKTRVLRELETRHGWPRLSINRELSGLLLDLTQKQRVVRLPQLLGELVDAVAGDVLLVDNIEMLFSPELGQDPLRLLQRPSRNRTLVVAWSGGWDGHCLSYAEPDHREWKRYDAPDALIVSAMACGEDR